MNFYLIRIEVSLKGSTIQTEMLRLVKATDKSDAITRAVNSVNTLNFDVLHADDLTIIPEEYNDL